MTNDIGYGPSHIGKYAIRSREVCDRTPRDLVRCAPNSLEVGEKNL
jgi:hypothetical protein